MRKLIGLFAASFIILTSASIALAEHGRGGGQGHGRGTGDAGGKALKEGDTVEVAIYAAASLQNALDEVLVEYKKKYPLKFTVNYASSGQIANQILHGAPADIFISAHEKWMDEVKKGGEVLESGDLLTNALVLVVPAKSSIKISTPQDLISDQVKHVAIAEPSSVPAGIYAKAVLEKLGLWEKVKDKMVSGADVRTTLSFVERDEAPAGIVYMTDAKISDKVKVAHTFDPALHEPIIYPVALLSRASDNGMARKLYDFLSSESAEQVFSSYGFGLKSKAMAKTK